MEAGTATLDCEPDEQQRHQTINLAIGTVEADGARITLVDTPGYADFQADVVEALAAVDAAIVVVDASAGVEVGTEEVWRLADERKLPRFVFVNKMDRENANYDAVLDGLKATFGPKIAPVYLPIGSRRVVPRLHRRDRAARQRLRGRASPRRCRSPTRCAPARRRRRESLVEAAAEASGRADDAATSTARRSATRRSRRRVHKGTREGSVVPVFVGRALKNIGVRELTRDDRQAHPVAGRGRFANDDR